MNTNFIIYHGNSAYCYSNCTAMLLSTIGEDIKPSLIEVIGGIGIGAFSLPGSNIAFLSNFSGLPDQAISRALSTLGFSFTENSSDNPGEMTLAQLKNILEKQPAILGPVDMGFLTYDPDHNNSHGNDHFVFAMEITDDAVRLHDPAGFPNAYIKFDELKESWKAERIGYKRGHFRYWTNPKKVRSPDLNEILTQTLKDLKTTYEMGMKYGKKNNRLVDSAAILHMIKNIETNAITTQERNTLKNFVFPVSTRRALDFAYYFKELEPRLSQLKSKQSELLGLCQFYISNDANNDLAKHLREYEKVEQEFKQAILNF